jgi:hypothetical protein
MMNLGNLQRRLCQAPVGLAGRLTQAPPQLVHFGCTISHNALPN